MKKVAILSIVLAFWLTFLGSTWPINAQYWTNISCVNGTAFKIFNTTINNQVIIRNETEFCGNLVCEDNSGCINPRETPGEYYLSIILAFFISAIIFSYLAIKLTSKEYAPIRILFFLLSFVMITSGIIMTNIISITLGHTGISYILNYVSYAMFGVFALLLIFQLVIILKWFNKQITKPKDDEGIDSGQ